MKTHRALRAIQTMLAFPLLASLAARRQEEEQEREASRKMVNEPKEESKQTPYLSPEAIAEIEKQKTKAEQRKAKR